LSTFIFAEFVSRAKKANKITNLRLTNQDEKLATPEKIEELKGT